MKKVFIFSMIFFLSFLCFGEVTAEWIENQLPTGSICLTGPDANGYWTCLIANAPPPGDDYTGYWNIKPLFFNNQFIGLEKFPTKNPSSQVFEKNGIEKKLDKIIKMLKGIISFFKISF